MSIRSRLTNLFRPDRLNTELEEELQSHIDEAIAQGREPHEARKAFGSPLRHREASRDVKLLTWLDSLYADLIFGWRQLLKRRTTSAAAILSLALAIGACTSAFRLVDAILLRPLPIAHPDRLYAMLLHGTGPDGSIRSSDSNEYPQFLLMRNAVKQDAELVAVGWTDRVDLTFASDQEMEKAHRQFVSGWMFNTFGLNPALGRVFTENDDLKPKAHAYAVLSYDYWSNRFGQDPKVIGRTFHLGTHLYEIIGVGPRGFTGTEPGTFTDIFLPAMMYEGVTHDDWSWIRTFIQMKPEGNTDRVRDRLQAIWNTIQRERAKGFKDWPPERLEKYLKQKVVVEPAGAGLSYLRESYKIALWALAVLVGSVLLIACANVANLLTAQAASRAREMALRISIGAGRGRLLQLMLIESSLLAVMAAALGVLFAWWSAPLIVSMINPPDNPARLSLPADWRVMAFTIALSVAVIALFGILPALRASAIKPANALKGGVNPHSRCRLMRLLIAIQVAFCFIVHLAASDFVLTLRRLTNQPVGFSAERLLTLETKATTPQPTPIWFQVADRLRQLAGVESVAIAPWALLSGVGQNGFVSVNGAPPHPLLGYFLRVSPGWIDTMKIPLLDGRDIGPDDVSPGADGRPSSVALVNMAFAKEYFAGEDPVGKTFDRGNQRYQIVGLVRNARYRSMREPFTATAYIPLRIPPPETLSSATFFVRTVGSNPLALASTLRREIRRARAEFRVSNMRTQLEINQAQTVRERLLAILAVFFAGVALLLAVIGLYGVLSYSVVQRRPEIGIRIAMGAPALDITRRVTIDLFLMVLLGSVAGVAVALSLEPYVKTLLYQVKASEVNAFVVPSITIIAASLLAALPAVHRAIRIDPARLLREE
jgi:predicted permease